MRSIAFARASVAREHDEMMRAEADAQDRLDLTAHQAAQGEFPECAPVVAANPDDPKNPGEDRETLDNVARRQTMPAFRPVEAIGPCCAHLVFVAREQNVRPVGLGHAAPPHGEHVIVRQLEFHIRLALRIFIAEQPVFLLQTLPKRRARQSLQQIDRRHGNLGLLQKIENPAPESLESVSRPRMIPETTSIPCRLMVRTASRIGTIKLCALSMAFRASGSGVSIPQKIVPNAASRMKVRISGERAMLSVASQERLPA